MNEAMTCGASIHAGAHLKKRGGGIYASWLVERALNFSSAKGGGCGCGRHGCVRGVEPGLYRGYWARIVVVIGVVSSIASHFRSGLNEGNCFILGGYMNESVCVELGVSSFDVIASPHGQMDGGGLNGSTFLGTHFRYMYCAR